MKKLTVCCLVFTFLFLLVSVNFLAAGGSQSQSSAAAGNTIRIGAVLPISGGSALFGEYQGDGYRLVVDRINAAGGILGKQVELVITDSASVADTGVTEFERLANNPSICAVIGTYNSGVASAIAPLAIKYKVPFMVTNAVADQILSENSNYIFRANPGDADGFNDGINFWRYLGQVKGTPIQKFAMVYENTDYGKGTKAIYERMAKELGATIVVDEPIQNESADLSSVINKVKQANPDVVVPVMFLNDSLLFSRQMMEYDCNVPIMAAGGGFLDVNFYDKAGKKLSDYVMSSAHWFRDVLDAACTQEARDIAAAYEKKVGHDINETVVNGWLGMYVLLDAIRRAGSADREAIARALDATDLPADHPALMFHPYPGVKFGDIGGRYNQNIYTSICLAQMQDGKFKLIYPPDMIAKNPLVFPLPPWNRR
jgi:branched-chain amino acid transport system substrate-binding protein